MVERTKDRNLHVLDSVIEAEDLVRMMVVNGKVKADIFLLANQMKDIAERFD